METTETKKRGRKPGQRDLMALALKVARLRSDLAKAEQEFRDHLATDPTFGDRLAEILDTITFAYSNHESTNAARIINR